VFGWVSYSGLRVYASRRDAVPQNLSREGVFVETGRGEGLERLQSLKRGPMG
jgi:hypothetical protein